MNISASSPDSTVGTNFPVYKTFNRWQVVNFCIWLVLFTLNTIKAINDGFRWSFETYSWPVYLVIMLLCVTDYLVSTTTFTLEDGHLAIKTRKLFYTKNKTYETDRMEELEVERVTIKKYPLKTIKITNEYILTFFYGDKEIALGEYLNKFDARGLYDAIIAAKLKESV